MQNKRTNAALKAWETRRANQQAQKFSDAAFKAWETRRKNISKKK